MREKVCKDYEITTGMLGVWVAKQEEIRYAMTHKKVTALKLGGIKPARFPRAEAELQVKFKERRRVGRRVTCRWLVATMTQLVQEMYKDHPGRKFIASHGWLLRCCRRLKIGMRTKTNCKKKAVQDRLPAVLQWLASYRFMLSTPLTGSMCLDNVWGRFPPHLRFNCDQVQPFLTKCRPSADQVPTKCRPSADQVPTKCRHLIPGAGTW
jgi:hypothetical protein